MLDEGGHEEERESGGGTRVSEMAEGQELSDMISP